MEDSIASTPTREASEKSRLEERLGILKSQIEQAEMKISEAKKDLAKTRPLYRDTVKCYREVLMSERVRKVTMERVGLRVLIYCVKITPEGEEREAIEMSKFWEVGGEVLCQAIKEGKITDELFIYDEAVIRYERGETGKVYLVFVTLCKSRLEK